MRRVFSAAGRILPPAIVLFLFVDLLMNPNIPRLGSSTGAGQPGAMTGDHSQELLQRANKLLAQGKAAEALEPVLKLSAAAPENHIYIKMLAEIHHRLGRYREEAEYWEKFLQYAPLPLEGCPDIGQAYWLQQRYREGIDAFERCLAFDPQMPDSEFFLAHALEITGNQKRAAAIYAEAVAQHPKNVDCRIGLARVEMRLGRVAGAKKRILAVLGEEPKNLDALLVAGLVYWREGDLARARQYLTTGAALSKGYADYHLVLGRIEESQGHIAEAALRYDRALQIQPDNEEASQRRQALTWRRR
jgi:tetratricopeptide (TPR) repeat protein